MSPSKKPKKICCHWSRSIGLAFLITIAWGAFSSGPEIVEQKREWMENAILKYQTVNAESAYSTPAYVATSKLSEEIKDILFAEKHIEHDNLRGIYITASTAASDSYDEIIDSLVKSGGNAVVIDIELSGGLLAFVPEDEYLTSINPGSTTLDDLKSMIRWLHRKDIYVIARQVVFNDPYAGTRKPEWRIKYKKGGLFDERWLDPSNPEVQDYNLAITREAAKLGFDEIQYDYIRFPAKNHAVLDYAYDENTQQRWEVINEFLKKANKVTDEYGVKLGVDVFGATIWGDVDWDNVGQYIPEIAKTVDAIYPMTYPSHVSPGYNGFKDPYGDPYSFVKASIVKFVAASAGNAEIRTWVQGFPLRIPNFGPWFVKDQVRATYDAGANDFVIWSPGNIYANSWSSLKMPAPEKEKTATK